MIANLFDKNIIKVIILFIISPGSKRIRKEIKEKTGMNNVPLDNALNKLLNFGIIKQEKNLFMLSQEYEFKELLEKIKKEFVEFNLPLRVYYIILEVSDKLSEIPEIKKIYLFGSYAKLIYHENSDIDLAIVLENKTKDKAKKEGKINKMIKKVSKKNKKVVETHFFLEKDMKAKDPLIRDILRNSKRLL